MEDLAFLENASASFHDIEENGPPVSQLPFEPAKIGLAVSTKASVQNPVTHEVMEVSPIIHEQLPEGRMPDHGYWIGRTLGKCIFGAVKFCTILKFRNDPNVPWEVTEHSAAVKIMSWRKIKQQKHAEDPQKEVAAMQHVATNGVHRHVIYPLDVLADDEYLLLFMPYCSSGELFSIVRDAGRLPEAEARFWFQQIIEGLCHLQRMGVCHRDMSLENMLVDEETRSLIIDLGMCLRVPFAADDGTVTDVSEGTLRLLMKPLSACGKWIYMAPEIIKSQEAFDGFAIDIWASGVILFIMLVGLHPWKMASREDSRYRMIIRGHLEEMLEGWEMPINPSAADLLQKIFVEDPRQRLTLSEIKDHPWFLGETENGLQDEVMEEWRV